MRSSDSKGILVNRRQSRKTEAVSPDLSEFLGMLDALELRMTTEQLAVRD